MGIRWPSCTLAFGMVLGAACSGTGTDLLALDNGATDAGLSSESGNPPPTPYQDPFMGAPAFSGPQGGGDGSHNSGRACMQAGCHASQGGGDSEAPPFLIGGTVYQDYYGMTPEEGVEVRIVDGSGNAMSTDSDRDGNFYIRADQTTSITFPAIVGARNASSTRPMIHPLTTASMGSCGQSPCHIPGGSPKTLVYYPIHVP